VINYPNNHAYTRITEMGHLTGEWGDKTKTVAEYPEEHVPNVNEPSYPIPRPENQGLYNRYRDYADGETPHIIFAGRLGDYQYYNMDQAVARAHALFKKRIAGRG
jgi:UDP-galactopyranose mutase